MNELSIEEKAQRYDEAIEKAKIFKEHLIEINEKDYADEIDYIFSELKDSEDERIRKAIIRHIEFENWTDKDIAISWLEKQKKQRVVNIDANKLRPAPYWENEHTSRKQDYSTLNDFERAIHRGFLCAGLENVPVTIIKETAKDALDNIIFIKHNNKVVSVSITKSS